MAADYEHGRNTMHLMLMLLLTFWCGITYAGLNVTARPYCRATAHDVGCAKTFTKNQQNAHKNWSMQDRLQLHCQSKNQNSYQNYIQKIFVPTGGACLHADSKITAKEQCNTDGLCDENDANPHLYKLEHSNTQGFCERACCSMHSAPREWDYGFMRQDLTDLCSWESSLYIAMCRLRSCSSFQCHREKNAFPKHPNSPWILIILFTLMSEIVHSLVAQELQRARQQQASRRVAKTCNLVQGGFWAFWFRALLLLWMVWFAGVWGCMCMYTETGIVQLRKPRKHKRAKYTQNPANRLEKFDVTVDVLCHGVKAPLHTNHITGDGNCFWRAVAKQTHMSWHKLKELTIQDMLQHATDEKDDELHHNIKLLSKKNAWANMLAVLGTVAFLQCEIRVCVKGHVIRCRPQQLHSCNRSRGRCTRRVISLHYENSHYSGVDAADVRHRIAKATFESSSSLQEFLSVPLDAYPKEATIARHRLNISRKVGSMPSPSRPAYRPAGPGLPSRRPNEDLASQITRVAKAKTAATTITTPPLLQSMPKVPPQPPVPPTRRQTDRMTTITMTKASSPHVAKTPVEPPYPPPGKEAKSIPQPKTPPSSPIPPKPPSARRKSSMNMPRATSTSDSTTATSQEIPPTLDPHGSSAGSVAAAATSESSGTTTRPVITAATSSDSRVQHPRLIRKPRTPPLARRAMPSAAPPVVELLPAVDSMSGGMCTDDKSKESQSDGSTHESAPRASFDVLVDRVVNEVSRRVLEHLAPAPYMVGLSVCVARMGYSLQCSSHDLESTWLEDDKQNKHELKLTFNNINGNETYSNNLQDDNFCTQESECGKQPRIEDDAIYTDGADDVCKRCRLHFWGFGLLGVPKSFSSQGDVHLACRKPIKQDRQANTSPAKSKVPKLETSPISGAGIDNSKMQLPASSRQLQRALMHMAGLVVWLRGYVACLPLFLLGCLILTFGRYKEAC